MNPPGIGAPPPLAPPAGVAAQAAQGSVTADSAFALLLGTDAPALPGDAGAASRDVSAPTTDTTVAEPSPSLAVTAGAAEACRPHPTLAQIAASLDIARLEAAVTAAMSAPASEDVSALARSEPVRDGGPIAPAVAKPLAPTPAALAASLVRARGALPGCADPSAGADGAAPVVGEVMTPEDTQDPGPAPRTAPAMAPNVPLRWPGSAAGATSQPLPPGVAAALAALAAANEAPPASSSPASGEISGTPAFALGAGIDPTPALAPPDAGAAGLGAPAPAGAVSPSRADGLPAIGVPLRHPQWGEEFASRVALMLRQQTTEAEIRVNPPELGPIEVRLKLDGERVHAQFVAPHADVREALSANLHRLRELLAGDGLSLGQTFVGQQGAGQGRDAERQPRGAADSVAGFAGSTIEQRVAPDRRAHTVRIGLLDEFA